MLNQFINSDNIIWDQNTELHSIHNTVFSEKIIRKYQDHVNWFEIVKNYDLSEDFILEFRNKLKLKHIALYQKISEDFIIKFKSNLPWDRLIKNDKIKMSESFLRKLIDRLDWLDLPIKINT